MSETVVTSRETGRDTIEDLLGRLAAISGALAEAGEDNEAGRTLTPEVVAALHDSGVFRLSLPAKIGGFEASPSDIFRVVEKLSYADASTGWVVLALGVIAGTTAAYIPDGAAEELFREGSYHLIAGQGTRMGTATEVEGGYLLTGSWQFASGMKLATHVHTAAVSMSTGEPLMFTLPKSDVEIVDNWDVMGLQATGSIDYSCKDVFVPDAYVFPIATKKPRRGGKLYELGLANLLCPNHSGWAAGAARRVLDELAEYARSKSGAPGAVVNSSQFAADFANAEASLRAARAFYFDVWRDIEASMAAGEDLTVSQESLARLSLNHLTWTAQQIAATAYKWGATTALRRGGLQRFFRDINAGTQHITSGPLTLQGCGAQLAGLRPSAHWQFFALVDGE
jgi:alkylation response protein AidB-like acyl-CoA dehydrogenase